MVIGLTIVGFGASAPEVLASVQAALVGQPAIAIGNETVLPLLSEVRSPAACCAWHSQDSAISERPAALWLCIVSPFANEPRRFSAWVDAQRPNRPTVTTTARNSAGAEPCYGWPQDTIEWWCDLGSDEENISENLHPSGEFMSAVYPTVRGMTFDHPINDSDTPVHSRDGHIHPRIWAGKHPRLTAGQHPGLRK